MVEQVVGGRTNNSQRGKKKRKDEKKGIALAGDARITSSKDNDSSKFVKEKKRRKLARRKKEKTEDLVDTVDEFDHERALDQEEAAEGNKELRETEKKKRKRKKEVSDKVEKVTPMTVQEDNQDRTLGEKRSQKSSGNKEVRETEKKKKRKREKGVSDKVEKITPITVQENNQDRTLGEKRSQKSTGNKKRKAHVQPEERVDEQTVTDNGADSMNGKPRKVKRKDKKIQSLSVEGDKILKVEPEPSQEEVYQISSGDEDSSKGMKKWVTDYYQSRPGLEVLQERIDEFIEVHEAKLEQERKEREALAAEGGWTVVTHHKGRKKSTETESGTVVGSVSQTAMEIKMSKKKTKEVGLDFYRFQRRETKRNELMMLQSKFEQDKKRIQELRAARKFRPY